MRCVVDLDLFVLCVCTVQCIKAGIPRRRHRHRHVHPREEIASVGRETVAVFGKSVSMSVSESVSAPWNASLTAVLSLRLYSVVFEELT